MNPGTSDPETILCSAPCEYIVALAYRVRLKSGSARKSHSITPSLSRRIEQGKKNNWWCEGGGQHCHLGKAKKFFSLSSLHSYGITHYCFAAVPIIIPGNAETKGHQRPARGSKLVLTQRSSWYVWGGFVRYGWAYAKLLSWDVTCWNFAAMKGSRRSTW